MKLLPRQRKSLRALWRIRLKWEALSRLELVGSHSTPVGELDPQPADREFFRARTVPGRSALLSPAPRSFAIASSFHRHSLAVLLNSVVQIHLHPFVWREQRFREW